MSARTLSMREMARAKARQAAREARVPPPPADDYPRPQTWGDCATGPRPCPYVACRYHLLAEITPIGSLHMPRGDPVEALDTAPETCALDVASRGPHTLEAVAELWNLTRERVRQIELQALHKLRREALLRRCR